MQHGQGDHEHRRLVRLKRALGVRARCSGRRAHPARTARAGSAVAWALPARAVAGACWRARRETLPTRGAADGAAIEPGGGATTRRGTAISEAAIGRAATFLALRARVTDIARLAVLIRAAAGRRHALTMRAAVARDGGCGKAARANGTAQVRSARLARIRDAHVPRAAVAMSRTRADGTARTAEPGEHFGPPSRGWITAPAHAAPLCALAIRDEHLAFRAAVQPEQARNDQRHAAASPATSPESERWLERAHWTAARRGRA